MTTSPRRAPPSAPPPEGGVVCDAAWADQEVVTGADGSFQITTRRSNVCWRKRLRCLEGNPSLRCLSYGVGLKPVPGDGDPVLGVLEGIEGYHIAFSHSGATLGLIAGELIADEVLN